MEAFWKGYLPRIEKSLPHIDACNETIKSDMEKVAALLPHIEADKRKSISPILHMAEGQIILNTILQVLDKEYLVIRMPIQVIQGSLQRHLKFGIMSTADSGIKLAEKVSCIELGS